MPFVTVREALELPGLQSLEVIAGEKGLDREIRDVTVLEVPDPFQWLKGGELVLTAFYGVRKDYTAQVKIIEEFAPTIAGICFNPGPGVLFSPKIIKIADELSLPILRMPGDMPYAKVITEVLQAILNRRAYLLSRSTEINSMMIKAILDGADLAEIISTLAQLVRNPVAFLDTSLNLIADAPYYEEGRDFLQAGLEKLSDFNIFYKENQKCEFPLFTTTSISNKDIRIGLQAVMIKSIIYGYIAVWEIFKKFDEVDIHAITHASSAIALHYVRSINLAEQRQKIINDISEDLLSGNYISEDSITKQGEVLGLDISLLNQVLVVQTADFRNKKLNHFTKKKTTIDFDEINAEIRILVENRFSDCLVSGRRGEIVVIINTLVDSKHKEIVKTLAQDIECKYKKLIGKTEVMVGIGAIGKSLDSLQQSYSQAKASIEIIKRLSDGRTIIAYEDLGIYRLLHEIPDTPEVKRFIEMILPGVENCDPNVLRTLEVFIETQKSPLKAGKNLYLHPNTVKYRVQKAKELWGYEILSDERCIDTLIAIKLKRIFMTPGHD